MFSLRRLSSTLAAALVLGAATQASAQNLPAPQAMPMAPPGMDPYAYPSPYAMPYGYPNAPYPMPSPYAAPYPPGPDMYGYMPPGFAPQDYGPQGYPYPGQGMPSLPGGWQNNDFFGGDNPFTNPMNNNGHWANRKFQPWRSGPFERNKWGNHPMNNMPWGRFPGWGDGFFGGYGPDQWKGITPWGNDVPFRWMDPTDPRESIGEIWDDAINTPNAMGRMPPGWTAPYISVPNPVDVEEEFERNARNFPDEIRKMWSTGEGGYSTDQSDNKPAEKPQSQQQPAPQAQAAPQTR